MGLDTVTYRKDTRHPNRYGYGSLRVGSSPTRPPSAIKAILMHTTNSPRGNTHYRPEAAFLRDSPDVSAHYVVSSHDDTVVQVLPESFIAWHAGDCADSDYENSSSIGIEIAWTINKGSLPQIAIDNTTALVRDILSRYPSIRKIDMHRAQAVPKGRKIDPSGWASADFYAWRDLVLITPPTGGTTAPLGQLLTEDSHIISPPRATLEQAARDILARSHGSYSQYDIVTNILPAYWRVCESVGIDPLIAIAMLIHETGNLSSALSQRKDKDGRDLRNPAGIGVWEAKSAATPYHRPGCVWDADVQGYRPSCQFASWANDAIPAHVGRLVAYALPSTAWNPAQQALVAKALDYRALPSKCWGSAPTLKLLGAAPNTVDGCGWASPGDVYGQRLAAIANRIRGL